MFLPQNTTFDLQGFTKKRFSPNMFSLIAESKSEIVHRHEGIRVFLESKAKREGRRVVWKPGEPTLFAGGAKSWVETTAYAVIALSRVGGARELIDGGLHTLRVTQTADGAWPTTRETAAAVGYEQDPLEVKVGVFNGDLDEEDDNDADGFVAAVSLKPMDGVELGAYWISDLGESDGLQDGLEESAAAFVPALFGEATPSQVDQEADPTIVAGFQ